MKILEWSTIDKAQWGQGEWQNEPDKKQWLDEQTGFPCLIVRQSELGHLCGYVGVPKTHPDYKKNYNDVDADVHGGLTFSDFSQPGEPEHGICHVVEDGEDDKVWWLGFDCAHYTDISPGTEATLNRIMPNRNYRTGTYKTFDFVKTEVASLAAQLLKRLKKEQG